MSAVDDPTLKLGLLLEAIELQREATAQAVQTLVQHTQGLDAVVREEIGITLREEFAELNAESVAAQRALRALGRAAALRQSLWAMLLSAVAAAAPLALGLLLLPSEGELRGLRAQEGALQERLRQLRTAGAGIELRRCGSDRRLCVRTERSAGDYGANGEFRIVKGY